jgi:hypothetical protein
MAHMAQNGTPKLTPKQKRAIAALLTSPSIVEAAQRGGIGRRTLHRWLNNATFQHGLAIAEGEAIAEATRRLIGLQGKIIDKLDGIMNEPNPQPGANVQVRAAVALKDYLLQLRELRNIEERLARLEEALLWPGQS